MSHLLLALGAIASLSQTPVTDEPKLPAGARVLLILEDERPDHFGWGAVGLGDVDGDKKPDLYIGARCGVSGLTQSRGYGSVFSGETGKRLYRVEGEEAEGGDAFGPRAFRVADCDGDGVADLAVKGELVDKWETYVKLFSGRTGSMIRRFERATDFFDLGVRERDGKRLFVLTSEGATRVMESTAEKALFEFSAYTLAITGDLDVDNRRDLLVYEAPGFGRTTKAGVASVRSGRDGKVLRSIPGPADGGKRHRTGAAGDANGDGFTDLVLSFYDEGSLANTWPAQEKHFRIVLVSGQDGAVLRTGFEELNGTGDLHEMRDLGDLDGDGKSDLFLAVHVRDAKPAARARIYSGADGKVIAEMTCDNWSFGVSASNVGDIDGDGRPDIAVGQHEFGVCQGRAYVISLGKP